MLNLAFATLVIKPGILISLGARNVEPKFLICPWCKLIKAKQPPCASLINSQDDLNEYGIIGPVSVPMFANVPEISLSLEFGSVFRRGLVTMPEGGASQYWPTDSNNRAD